MTIWKDGGNYGRLCREVTDESGDRAICRVWTRRLVGQRGYDTEPWPEGKRNFRLILNAPQTADALRVIADGAIVSPEQPPEKIAEQVLRVLQIMQEAHLELREIASTQQRQAGQMLAALCSIRDQAECFLQPLTDPSVSRARWEKVRDRAVAAITATKGEGNDSIG